MVEAATSGADFFSAVPEMLALKAPAESARANRKAAKPCCGKGNIPRGSTFQEVFAAFSSTALTLPPDAVARLKRALGVGGKLYVRGLNRRTGAYELVAL
jgi:hypothetical protein